MYENSTGQTATEDELLGQYRDMLDEVYGPVRIGSLEYSAAHVLERVDPTAYRCGFNDWMDAEGWDEAW